MTPDNDVEKLLGGFATNSLTDQERTQLFTAALTNQRLFDALADEQALKELLDDPRSRRLLIQALKEKQSKATRLEKLQAWFPQRWYQPSAWAVAGGAVVALLAVTVVVHLVGLPPQAPDLMTDATPPVSSAPDSPSSPKPRDLPSTPLPDRKVDPSIPPTKRPVSPSGQPKSALTTPADRMNKEEAPASPPAAPAEKKEQEQYAAQEQTAAEPSLHKSSSSAGDSRKPDADEMTADKQPVPEGKAKIREEARRFSPMAGLRGTSQDAMKNASPTPNIQYTVLREESQGTYSSVDPETTFRAGDRVRLALEPRDNGYLYVLTQGPTGNVKILFPPDETGETARVDKMVRYLVPTKGAFTFETPIDQRVTIVFSQKRLPDVRSLLQQETAPQKQTETDVRGGLAERDRNRSATPAPLASGSGAAPLTRVEITLKHQ